MFESRPMEGTNIQISATAGLAQNAQRQADAAIAAAGGKVPDRIKIEVKDLNFYYGKFLALKNINMEIPEKKVTAFIGPSGCGKSTLLRTFNKMFALYPEQRAEGQINVDGENIVTSKTDVSLIRAKIEELIAELKQDYTVLIVTHNMQQAARCSDHTAYMYLGELIEFGETDQIFIKPKQKATEDYITGRFG